MNPRLFLCLVFVLCLLETITSAKKSPQAKTRAAKSEENDDVTVEEISEEEYKEQQKQGARTVKDFKPKPKKAGKDDKPGHSNIKDDAKINKKEKEKTGESKQDHAKPTESGQPENDAGKNASPESNKEERGSKSATADEEKSDESKGEMEENVDEAKGELEEKKEEEEEEHEAPSGIRDPRPCEVCKYLAVELQGRLDETGKVKEYIETGHGIMPGDRKRKDYKKSELRLIEAVHEPHVCDKILEYDIHAERKKSLRYAKGSSETRKTLHWLRSKGVKVDMGMPEDMWTKDAPSTEITHLQRLCFELVEMYEEDIEDWYWGHQELHLYDYLCRDRALKGKDQECLKEEFVSEEDKKKEAERMREEERKRLRAKYEEESQMKGDDGISSSAIPPTSIHATPHTPSTSSDATRTSTPEDAKMTQSASPQPTKTASPAPSSQTKEEL